MIQGIRIYLHGAKVAIASRMAYRADMFISMLIMLMVEMVVPLITILIYNNGAAIPGWSVYEVLLLQGVFMLARGIAFPFFFGIVWNVIRRVQEGTFDLILIKPRSELFIAIVTGFDTEDLGKLVGGATLFSLAVSQLPPPSTMQWLQFIALFLVSILAMFGIGVIMAGIGVVWIGNFRVYEVFVSVTNFANYPASIFSKSIQTVILSILPISILGFIPASALLGRPDAGTLTAIITGIGTVVVSLLFWKAMMRKYTSAGG